MLKPKFLVIFTIILLAFAGCFIDSLDDYISYIVVNNYDKTITRMTIGFIDSGSPDYFYLLDYDSFPKGKSNVKYLERFDEAFNGQVAVWFGSEYDIKDYRFAPGETTVITLNENGILE